MEIILKYFADFTEKQLHQFKLLGDLYTEWNEKINVISRKDIGGLYEKHVLHSLSIAAVFEFKEGMNIIDIGTGGGFPGIPLAIFFPEVKFHLVDSIGKKLKVVEAIIEGTGLENVTIQQTRIGEPGHNEIPEKFDFVVSRAVAPLKDLYHWARPLFRKKSSGTESPALISLKGGDLGEEIRESKLRPELISIYELFPEEYFREKYMLISRPRPK